MSRLERSLRSLESLDSMRTHRYNTTSSSITDAPPTSLPDLSTHEPSALPRPSRDISSFAPLLVGASVSAGTETSRTLSVSSDLSDSAITYSAVVGRVQSFLERANDYTNSEGNSNSCVPSSAINVM